MATIKERSPEVHLFLELPADRVDVNVHPTKAEVRFLDQGLVHEVLRRAVIDALGATGAPELVLAPAPRRRPRGRRPGRCRSAFGRRPAATRRAATRPAARRGAARGGRGAGGTPAATGAGGAGARRPPGREAVADADPAHGAARPVPQHVHHRGRRRGPGDHRPARGARAHPVRADLRAPDRAAARVAAAARADRARRRRRARIRRWWRIATRSCGSASSSRTSAASSVRVAAVPALLD